MSFGPNTDKLFGNGPVSLKDLIQANAADIKGLDWEEGPNGTIETSVNGQPAYVSMTRNNPAGGPSQREKDREKYLEDKYKMNRLELDKEAPKSIDIPKDSKPSKFEGDRLGYLRDKFKLDGISYSCWSHNGAGGFHKIDVSEPKRADSSLLKAYGSYKRMTRLEVEVT